MEDTRTSEAAAATAGNTDDWLHLTEETKSLLLRHAAVIDPGVIPTSDEFVLGEDEVLDTQQAILRSLAEIHLAETGQGTTRVAGPQIVEPSNVDAKERRLKRNALEELEIAAALQASAVEEEGLLCRKEMERTRPVENDASTDREDGLESDSGKPSIS